MITMFQGSVLVVLLAVGLVLGAQPQFITEEPLTEEELTINLIPMGFKVLEEKTSVGDKNKPATSTTTNSPVTDSIVPIELSQRLFFTNYDDAQRSWKTLDLSGLNLSGEDVMNVLYSLNSTVLCSVARLDLSHNRVRDLPARIWPLQLEYSLRELRLDYNSLNIGDPINTRTSRFELTRLRSLQRLSLAHCNLGITLDNLEFPPVQSLDLSGNRLVELPSGLATLATLKHLDVSGNCLRYLSGSPLASLTDLRTLNLSHNGLEKTWDEPLEPLYSLETLSLDHNALTEPVKMYQFTGSYQPRMQVYMSGNPFKCGCSFKNILGIERLQIIDKDNVTCVDDSGVEWSVDSAQANHCSPNWEVVNEKWIGTKEWFRENHPDWSTFYRSLGWIFFGVMLGLVYTHRRNKKTPPPSSQLPYNILDESPVC